MFSVCKSVKLALMLLFYTRKSISLTITQPRFCYVVDRNTASIQHDCYDVLLIDALVLIADNINSGYKSPTPPLARRVVVVCICLPEHNIHLQWPRRDFAYVHGFNVGDASATEST